VEVLLGPEEGSPKFHSQETILVEFAIDESAKWVGLPIQAVSAVNLATGAALTDTVWPTESKQPTWVVTIKFTQKFPLWVKA
jgi:hypothetical protein